jgi:flagellar biosynthetic protein FliP
VTKSRDGSPRLHADGDCRSGRGRTPARPLIRALAAACLALPLLAGGPARAAGAGGAVPAAAVPGPFESIPKIPGISGEKADQAETATVIQIVMLITVLTLAPSILMLMTCFTRVVIVLSFLRRALATQQLPPNQIIVGLSLFLTFAIMAPVLGQANREALQPYLAKQISQKQALERAVVPFRRFMLSHTRRKDLRLFVSLDRDLADRARAAGGALEASSIPTLTIIPAFVLSEMKVAFWMGFLLYLPFLIIDLVTASVLMSMGMMFLPPVMVSMPFKILLFVLVDGWYLVVGQVIQSIGPVT